MTAKELLSECCHSCHSKNACDHVRTLSYAVKCHTLSYRVRRDLRGRPGMLGESWNSRVRVHMIQPKVSLGHLRCMG